VDNKKEDKSRVQLNVRVPAWLKQQAKIKALQEGRNLEEVLQELIEQWLRDNPQENK
jgi:molybdopterin converting factor small subunit